MIPTYVTKLGLITQKIAIDTQKTNGFTIKKGSI